MRTYLQHNPKEHPHTSIKTERKIALDYFGVECKRNSRERNVFCFVLFKLSMFNSIISYWEVK